MRVGGTTNWRQQHEDFITSIRSARTATDAIAKGLPLPPPPPPSINPDYVECPYCLRRFNETAAPRHINFCKTNTNRRVLARPSPQPSTSYIPPQASNMPYVQMATKHVTNPGMASQVPAQSYQQPPSQSYPQSSPQSYHRPPSQSHPHAPPQSYHRPPSQSYPQSPSQSQPQGPSQSYQRPPSQSYPQSPSQSYPQSPSQSQPQGPSQSYQRPPSQSYPQSPSQSYPQSPSQSYPQSPSQSYPQSPPHSYPQQQTSRVPMPSYPVRGTVTSAARAAVNTNQMLMSVGRNDVPSSSAMMHATVRGIVKTPMGQESQYRRQ
ncbi:gamma-gliadin [Callorhinchus milii]|uniref:gamma-gliadin n=1 Tax=Callorhinchus milii TaxID=7868 RepID=UPI0004575CE3|nr:gamma-gliadin [Callorhinchus milii]|eukprot:gi/632975992/ref/XP_007904542.1/ PREDICTED: zinc finger C2HC domain-containing protein 1B [Callorhinchus milii]